MTITFCLVPFIPLAAVNVLGLIVFRIPFLILSKLLDMKNYSRSRPINYNVTSLISYFQCQRINYAAFKFLILKGAGFETRRVFRTSIIVHK